jgi:hypothetical protein
MKIDAVMKVRRIMWSSPLEFSAGRGGDAKAIGNLYQRGQQCGGVVAGSIERVVGQQIGGTALHIEVAEVVEIAGERSLRFRTGNAGADDFKRCIEKNDGGGVAREEFAIGGLKERASTEGEDRRPGETGEEEIEMMVLDGAEAALASGGEQIGNGAVSAGDFDIEIDERAGQPEREEASDGGLADPHESDEGQ